MAPEQVDEQRARKADDIEVVPVDPLDEPAAEPLDRVGAGPAAPLATDEIGRDGLRPRARGT